MIPPSTTCAICAHSLANNKINAQVGIKLAESFKEMPSLTSVK